MGTGVENTRCAPTDAALGVVRVGEAETGDPHLAPERVEEKLRVHEARRRVPHRALQVVRVVCRRHLHARQFN